MEIFTGTVANGLKKTLNKVITDKTDNLESKMVLKRWCKQPSMEDNYEDDLEVGGPGLATEKPEGQEIAIGTIQEGYITRYIARTFALRLLITEEAMEDCKYPEMIKAAKRLKRAMMKTADIDAANMKVRGFNTAYVGGDGLPLWSASHTLPGGGTFSNTMATPMSPSRIGLQTALTQIKKFPSQDGIVEGYEGEKILCPIEQEFLWEEIVGSKMAPEAGEFNRINVVNRLFGMSDIVADPHWSNTTTNWAVQTDAEDGFQFRWRRRPRARTWVENSHEVMMHSQSARWARGWSNPRCTLGVQA